MKKRVLHVSPGGLPPGGVGSVVLSIAKQLHTEFDFHFVVFNREHEYEKNFEQYGTMHRISCYPKKGKRSYLELFLRPFKLYFGIKSICKKQSFDVIHCHNQHDCVPCLLAAKHLKIPVRISHAHVGNDQRKRFLPEKIFKKILLKQIKKVSTLRIACSQNAGDLLFGKESFVLVPNGIDLMRFCRSENRVSTAYSFVHIGRYTYAKNQEFVLETFALLFQKLDFVHLYLVGYGDSIEVERLTTLINKLGIEQRVEMIPGDKIDVVNFYDAADYMIFPSRFEGFPVTLMEAQAMGIQCYVSENITHEVDVGLLTFLNLAEGPKAWAERIFSDIQNGTKKVLDTDKLLKYSNEYICRQYSDIYNGKQK